MEDNARSTQFDPYELMALESVLSPSEVAAEGERALAASVPSMELCRKIGSALLVGHASRSPTEIALTEREAWALRERVGIFMAVGQRQDVGLSIKLKLYRLLLDFDTAAQTGALVEVEHEEQSAKEVRDALLERGD